MMSTANTKTHSSEKTAAPANKSHAQKTPHAAYSTFGPEQTPFISPEFSMTSVAGIQMLQRTMGNRAVNRFIQTKLTVGKPGDKYEMEADRVATQVIKMPAPVISPALNDEKEGQVKAKPIVEKITSFVQSQSDDEEKVQNAPVVLRQSEEEVEQVQRISIIERQEEEETVQAADKVPEKEGIAQTSPSIQSKEEKEEEAVQIAPAMLLEKEEKIQSTSGIQFENVDEEKVQTTRLVQRSTDDKDELQLPSATIQRRESMDGSGVSQQHEQMIHASRGSGAPLSPNTRNFFENRFSTDFSGVRVHTDSQASRLSQNLNAQAFTVGNDIYFNKGKYDTGTSAGKGLLAHELTHTIQQGASGGAVQNQNTIQREISGSRPAAQTPSSQQTSGQPSSSAASAGSAGGGQASAQSNQSSVPSSHSQTGSNTSAATGAGEISGAGQQQQASPEGSPSSAGPSASAGAASGNAGQAASAGASSAGSSDSLLLEEYRSELTDEEMTRLADVEERSSVTASETEELPSASETVTEAQEAVEEPEAETASRAQGDIIAALDHREPPSPEIEEICQRIREVIRSKRPPDEDSLVDADPQLMAQEAGSSLDSSIQGDTQRVQGEFNSVNQTPEGQPSLTPQEPEAQPESVETTDINATAATPDAPGSENVDLSADVEANRNRMDEAGMDSEPAQLVQEGPLAEARDAQGELEQMAERDPAEVLAETIQSRANAAQNMAELQQRAMEALAASRVNTVNSRAAEQNRTSETEEQIRQRIGNEAQQIVNNTREQVNSLLEPLSRNAMQRWNTGKDVLATRFSQTLAEVKSWIDERHSGVEGFIVSIGDAIVGLPDWVTETYDRAEREFGDGVCDLIRYISSEVNGVIASAQALISDSRDRIVRLFTDNLPQSLQSWAAEQQALFEGQLNELHQSTEQTRDNLNHQLAEQAAQSVQEARTQIHELRVAAGGIVGRIEAAVNQFLEDPVKFIIDGLLSLAGISPPAFWALINRIQSVINDIADDPINFANNLAAALGQGFSKFFDNFSTHILSGFFDWLFSGLGSVGVQIPSDFSLKSIITFALQLMGITWPNIRRMLVKHIGEENIALIEQAVQLLSTLIEQGPEGIFELIKEKLDPQTILNQILEAAVSYLIETLITRISARIIMMFNPAGAIVQAIEVIYRIISWVFQNAARIFSLVETVVNGAAQLIAGNISGMAGAVEGALARLIAPVIDFLAGFLGLGNLPDRIAETIGGFQQVVLGIIEKVIDFLAKKAKGLLGKVKAGVGAIVEWWKAKASFEDGEGKKHTLFFKGNGKNAKLFMRSNEISIENRINEIEDTKKREELNGLYQSTVVQPIQMNAEREMPEQERNKFQENVANALKMIAEKLGDLDQMPPTAVTYNLSGGRPGLVIAEPLTKKAGNTQKQASGSRSIIKGENMVDKWVNKTGNKHPQSEALGVHILADHLHGPWTEWNIVFGSKSLNENMKQPEKQANDHRDQELKYDAKVRYFSDTNKDSILESVDEPSIEDLKNALSYYIAESISVKVSNKEGTTYYSNTVSGNMPNITGEPIKSINELIIQLFKQKTTGEEIQSEGTTYIKTIFTNYKNIASDISKDNERVRKTLRNLIDQKVIANLAGCYYLKKGL